MSALARPAHRSSSWVHRLRRWVSPSSPRTPSKTLPSARPNLEGLEDRLLLFVANFFPTGPSDPGQALFDA